MPHNSNMATTKEGIVLTAKKSSINIYTLGRSASGFDLRNKILLD